MIFRACEWLAFALRRPVEIAAIRHAERGGASVFWVHARRANLRGQSDLRGARAVLCALAARPRRTDLAWYHAIVPLHSSSAVDAWILSGASVDAREAEWLRANA